jgi:iron(III) transport system permease protein
MHESLPDVPDGVRHSGDDRPVAALLLGGAVAAAVSLPVVWIALTAIAAPGVLSTVTSPRILRILGNSLALVAAVTTGAILVGVPLSYLTTRTNLPGRRLWTVLLVMPLVLPGWIGAFAYVAAFGPNGRLQGLLAPLGVDELPALYGFPGTALVLTLYSFPYVLVTTRAALTSLDGRLIEAARTLEDSRLAAFRRVSLPLIRPAVSAGALLVALNTLAAFGEPMIMRFDVFTRAIYVEFNTFGRDAAALLSLQLVVLTLVLLAIETRLRRATGRQSGGAGTDVHDLGRWRWPVTILPAAVVAAAVGVPLWVLVDWLSGPTPAGVPFRATYAFNTAALGIAAAVLVVCAAAPVAALSRRRSLPARAVEASSYVAYAVPGVVVGVALVSLAAHHGGQLYQRGILLLPMLLFAYVVRFLPEAVGGLRSSVFAIDPRLPEAARTLGRSPLSAHWEVTFPLAAPGIVAAAALAFIATVKELPATLLLRPDGVDTLATYIWAAYSEGFLAAAALPALVLFVVSTLAGLLIVRT